MRCPANTPAIPPPGPASLLAAPAAGFGLLALVAGAQLTAARISAQARQGA